MKDKMSIDKDAVKIVIDVLLSGKYYGAGDNVEIAKGKNEYASTFKIGFNKIKRILK